MSVFSHPEFDQHEHVAFYHDKRSGLKAIIAIHNTHLGPALGGCRMWPYGSDTEALNDVLRLSKGMTYKSAISNLKLGGGKSVIIGDPRMDKSADLLYAMGDFVESLGGRYITAEDSGTGVADIATMGERTAYISGVVDDCEHGGDPSPTTAYGVYIGLQESVRYRLGCQSLDGVKVAIQGLGNVGFCLATYLHKAGAELFVTDIVESNVERAVSELGATAVSGAEIYGLDVDVYAPCALGATINASTISQLKAAVIAGAANNQLARVEGGELLRQREILYAPDYVINAGGIIDVYYQRNQGCRDQLKVHVEGIAGTLKEIFDRSFQSGQATNKIADVIAEERFGQR